MTLLFVGLKWLKLDLVDFINIMLFYQFRFEKYLCSQSQCDHIPQGHMNQTHYVSNQ